jgi:hypothetical protein
MNIEEQFDALKKKISEAYDWRDPGTGNLPELVQASLDSAENLLLQARRAHSPRMTAAERHFFKMAEMRYTLALTHFKGAPKSRKKLPSLLSQHRIGALGANILTFKTKVEWKNTELTMAHRNTFNKIVSLFEDALNKLHDGQIDDAERIASGAWLYYYNLCCALNEDPGDKASDADARKKLFGILTKNKVPPAISGVKNLSLQMREVRARFEHLQTENSSVKARWEGLEDALDFLIGQAIATVVEDDEYTLNETIYKAQEHLVLMERFVREMRATPDVAHVEASGANLPHADNLVSRRQFYAMADSLGDLLHSRVSLLNPLSVRLLNLRRLYDQAMRAYESHLAFEVESLLSPARDELSAIKLIVKEALLSGDHA